MILTLSACPTPYTIVNDPASQKRSRPEDLADFERWRLEDKYNPAKIGSPPDVMRAIFDRKEYVVGCGKCNICLHERLERKQNKWCSRLIGMINEYREHGVQLWNRGKLKVLRGSVFFMSLTVSNRKYPACETRDGSRLPNHTIKRLNKSYAFRAESYEVLKSWVQTMLKNTNYNRRDVRYVLFPEWGTDPKGTNRLHLHAFLFVPGDSADGGDWCRGFLSDWRKMTNTTEGEFRVVEDSVMASVYASKYSTKIPGRHRVMASQMNWLEYERKFSLDKHGLPCEFVEGFTESGYRKWIIEGGSKKWHVVKETVPVDVLSNVGLTLQEALRAYMEGLSVVGSLVLAKPDFSIFLGGYIRCEEKDDYTLRETLANIPQLPAGCSLLVLPHLTTESRGRRLVVLEDINQQFQLPPAIQEVLYASFPPLLCAPALLFKVFAQVSKRYRTKSTQFIPPLQS